MTHSTVMYIITFENKFYRAFYLNLFEKYTHWQAYEFFFIENENTILHNDDEKIHNFVFTFINICIYIYCVTFSRWFWEWRSVMRIWVTSFVHITYVCGARSPWNRRSTGDRLSKYTRLYRLHYPDYSWWIGQNEQITFLSFVVFSLSPYLAYEYEYDDRITCQSHAGSIRDRPSSVPIGSDSVRPSPSGYSEVPLLVECCPTPDDGPSVINTQKLKHLREQDFSIMISQHISII